MAISLKIKGNKRTNEGIGNDLVTIGSSAFPVIDAQYPGAKGASDFIVVRHLHDKSIYTIVCKNVTPCDSSREGTLYIAVCVPAGEQVIGIFNMLIELQNAFKQNCMTFDGKSYKFTPRPENPAVFEEIIARHKVTPYPYKGIPSADDTSEIAYIFMTPEQISDVLNDPMRPEFARFGQIVLIPVADPSTAMSTITIPAKIWRSYKIFVNGRPTAQTISDPNKSVTITLPENNTHEAASASFSIAKARDTKIQGIVVDDQAQVIYINLPQKRKEIVPPPPSLKPEHTQKPADKKKRLAYIIAGVLIILAIGAIAYFVLAPKNAPAPGNAPTATAPDSTHKKDQPTDSLGNRSLNDWGEGDSDELTDNENGTVTDQNDGKQDANGRNENVDPKTGKKTEPQEDPQKKAEELKRNLKKKFKENVTKVNDITGSFGSFKELYRQQGNYSEMDGYKDYEAKLELIYDYINYISSLSSDITDSDYGQKLRDFERRADNFPALKAKIRARRQNKDSKTDTKHF